MIAKKAAIIEDGHDGMDHDTPNWDKEHGKRSRAAKKWGKGSSEPENLRSLQDLVPGPKHERRKVENS